MKVNLIEYDYAYESYDACKGLRTYEASKRALLFVDDAGLPIAAAIPNKGELEIFLIKVQNGRLVIPVWKQDYTIANYEVAPFQEYRVVKSLPIPENITSFIEHAVICSMKIDDLRKFLIELIRKESRDLGFRI